MINTPTEGTSSLAFHEVPELFAKHVEGNVWIDYQKFSAESGFEVVEKRNPLGRATDPEEWESELEHSPCTVYVLKKRD